MNPPEQPPEELTLAGLEAALGEAYQSAGMAPEAGAALARFNVVLAQLLAEERVLQLFRAVRGTRAGCALWLALDPSAESIRDAARRLSCSPGSLSKLVNEFRRRIQNHGNTACENGAHEVDRSFEQPPGPGAD